MAVCQNVVPLVNPKIAGKWMFIPLKMVLIGIDPYPYQYIQVLWKDSINQLKNHQPSASNFDTAESQAHWSAKPEVS